jgi:hypothetical protein
VKNSARWKYPIYVNTIEIIKRAVFHLPAELGLICIPFF